MIMTHWKQGLEARWEIELDYREIVDLKFSPEENKLMNEAAKEGAELSIVLLSLALVGKKIEEKRNAVVVL